MLTKSDIRTNEQLKADGFAEADIKNFRRFEGSYYAKLIDLDTANDAKDWDTVIDLEPEIEKLEFLLKYQGKNPKDIPVVDLKAIMVCKSSSWLSNEDHTTMEYRKKIRNHGTAVRAFCVSCMNGQPSEVRACGATHCPLWPFRLGKNPFFGRTLMPVEEIAVEDDEIVEIDESDEGSNDGD